MQQGIDEEKKDLEEEELRRIIGVAKGDEEGKDREKEDDDEEDELADLPEEVSALLGGRVFSSEAELSSFLDTIGFGDLRAVLVNGIPRQIMPSDQHNGFTTEYLLSFSRWAKNKWGCASTTHKIHLVKPNGGAREPDLSYWGYPRCHFKKDGTLVPKKKGLIPDVVIQFSWRNKKKYEEDAINDMMNRGLEEEGKNHSMNCPRIGYLIKVRFSKKRKQAGGDTQDMESLEVYKLLHGTTVKDAVDGVKGAEKFTYYPNGPDQMIGITPQDLGITGFWAMFCGTHKIRLSDVFRDMNGYHKYRQSLGLNK